MNAAWLHLAQGHGNNLRLIKVSPTEVKCTMTDRQTCKIVIETTVHTVGDLFDLIKHWETY